MDDLPTPAAAAAIDDEQILRRAREIADCVRDGGVRELPLDPLGWRGGLYYGVRNQQRLTVGVRVPWWSGPHDVGVVASHLGRLGAPGMSVRTLAQLQVPYYAAAATPVREHATTCLGLGLSTTAEHVVALLEVVREVLRTLDLPASRMPFLRASAGLHEAIHPSSGPFDQPASDPTPVTRPPAVAVVGRLPEQTVTEMRALVHAAGATRRSITPMSCPARRRGRRLFGVVRD
ncbi:hypothetical protein ACLQ24_15110 [Micromonospora sp. DT4]|uniref:hypothetical protein n=1 Tax=Micromonospora sp. DT4 TaxID=3393438 RepID=UPI003CF97F30